VELAEPLLIDRVVMMEDLSGGERVRRYAIEGLERGKWRQLHAGTAIGHKRIDLLTPASVAAVRLRILESVGTPLIRRLAVYRVSG
jgi:alpha-L-fucosidase